MGRGFIRLAAFFLRPARFEVGRRSGARCPVQIGFAICVHDAEIVLRVLIKVFGGDAVTTCRRFAGERDIPFKDLISVATDLYIRSVAIESLDPVR